MASRKRVREGRTMRKVFKVSEDNEKAKPVMTELFVWWIKSITKSEEHVERTGIEKKNKNDIRRKTLFDVSRQTKTTKM